jgi:hypothetical protein
MESAPILKVFTRRLEAGSVGAGTCALPTNARVSSVPISSIRRKNFNRKGFSGSVKMRLFIVSCNVYLLKRRHWWSLVA